MTEGWVETPAVETPAVGTPAGDDDFDDDPRWDVTVGVLMANGRLAGRSFRNHAEAEAWAQDGEEVVELNAICDCDR